MQSRLVQSAIRIAEKVARLGTAWFFGWQEGGDTPSETPRIGEKMRLQVQASGNWALIKKKSEKRVDDRSWDGRGGLLNQSGVEKGRRVVR